MLIYLFLLFSLIYSLDGTVLAVGGESYSIHDFFSRYPKKQWERADGTQKEKMFDDFISRKLCVLEARNLGFQHLPEIAVKIQNRSLQILVNESYEYFVAEPLIPEENLMLARQNAKKEVFVNHILIGHSGSHLGRPPKRTLDEALLLSVQIKKNYEEGEGFGLLAEMFSDDPGVVENLGEVGWVSWGATVQEFQTAAFSLDPGTVSSPVLTDFGYHLILVSDVRGSDYQYMEDPEYESLVVNITKNSIRDKLRPAAIEYDRKMIEKYGVVFNMRAISKILSLYSQQKKDSGVSGVGRNVSFLEKLPPLTVVCVYGGKGFGPMWFLRRLEKTPQSRWPGLESEEGVLSAFKKFILQDIAINKGFEAGVDSLFSYRWKVNNMVSDLLYDSYLDHLVSVVPTPDSIKVIKYYEDSGHEGYMEEEKIIVREIMVADRNFADSLLSEINVGRDFSLIAKTHSLVSPELGGLRAPLSKKQGDKYFDITSALKINGVSPVISMANGFFSIVQLVERVSAKPYDLWRVYSQVESLLLKEEQEASKSNNIKGLIKKYNISENTSILYP